MESFENQNFYQSSQQGQPVYQPPVYQPPVQQPVQNIPVYQRPEYERSPFERPAPQQNVPVQPRPEQKEKKPRKGLKVFGSIMGAIALVVASSILTAILVGSQYDTLNKATSNRLNVMQDQLDKIEIMQPSNSQEPSTDEMLPSQVYQQAVHTVVAITSTVVTEEYGEMAEGIYTGSGVILSADGYVATNYHVVQGSTYLSVTTYDNQEYSAQLVGYDAANDIAVLKVEATDLPCATIGSSDSLKVGDRVAAIGNPLGELTATMTVGYISGKDRLVNTDGTVINMIQTDAAINSGNSGGPLFNMYGEVVGITTAKYSGVSNSGANIEGIGFAIPIDDVVDIIDDLMQYGYITGAYLGVMVRDLDPQVAQSYGLPLGVRVEEVTPGFCAQKAGLMVGDIIINLGGYEVSCLSDLSRALRKFDAGDETTITVYRAGAEVHLDITLSEKPVENAPLPETEASMPANGDYDEWYDYFFGQD